MNGTGDGPTERRGSMMVVGTEGVDDDEVVNEGWRCLSSGLAGSKH